MTDKLTEFTEVQLEIDGITKVFRAQTKPYINDGKYNPTTRATNFYIQYNNHMFNDYKVIQQWLNKYLIIRGDDPNDIVSTKESLREVIDKLNTLRVKDKKKAEKDE